AGAVLTSTGERDMDRLGGLIHRMPLTSFVVLVGCVAISALPPFNGFVSEWLMFQAVLQSPELPQWALKITVPAVGALLALAAALAAACFVKAYGVTFLGRPRGVAAETAEEVDRYSLSAMFILARDHVEMPPPGDTRPARLRIELHDLIWERMYEPIADVVGFSADKLNRLQFLTIRRYLSLVFATLVTLLLVLAIWS